MGGILMIGALDCLQIQPIYGKQFILSHSIIPCIKINLIKRYVRASGGIFFKIQSITRKYYNKFDSNPSLIQ